MKNVKELISGNDPAREAKGNMAVINCTIMFITCLFNVGLFPKYRDLFSSTTSKNAIYVIAIFIVIYTVCYCTFRKLQTEKLTHSICDTIAKIKTSSAVIEESIKIGQQYLTENYTRPLKEKLNLFSCIFLIYLSYLVITGASILTLVTNSSFLHISIIAIALLILLKNIYDTDRQFVWRTITG